MRVKFKENVNHNNTNYVYGQEYTLSEEDARLLSQFVEVLDQPAAPVEQVEQPAQEQADEKKNESQVAEEGPLRSDPGQLPQRSEEVAAPQEAEGHVETATAPESSSNKKLDDILSKLSEV